MAAPTIDFVSDIVCPWCFIGFTRLEQALAKSGITDAEITMHPFLLDASVPAAGVDLRESLTRKFRGDPEKMFGRVEAAAKESGIPLDFAKVRRYPNTLKAHALIGEAKERGTQLAVARALYNGYFLEGLDVGDDEVLLGIATANGFTREEGVALLADRALMQDTEIEASSMAEQGITGVPFLIFEGKLALSGAQPIETIQRAMTQARDGAPAPA